jgi:hypothetical protein
MPRLMCFQPTTAGNTSTVASCWIYEYIGILLGACPILHISRLKVKKVTMGSTSGQAERNVKKGISDKMHIGYVHVKHISFNVRKQSNPCNSPGQAWRVPGG